MSKTKMDHLTEAIHAEVQKEDPPVHQRDLTARYWTEERRARIHIPQGRAWKVEADQSGAWITIHPHKEGPAFEVPPGITPQEAATLKAAEEIWNRLRAFAL